MERRAKERLIGASILVVLVVLIVPELLSGPKPPAPPAAVLPAPSAATPDPVRTVTVDLATSKSTSADADTAPVDAAAPASAAPASAAGVAETASTPASSPLPGTGDAAAHRADAKAPSAPSRPLDSSPAAPISSRDWAVQLGSFANRGNAENLVHQLKAQGFQVYDSATGAGRAQRFRVRVGPLPDRAAAERTIAKLKALKHAASVVPPAR